jgi:nucleoside-diphosphate-sugar epimerase
MREDDALATVDLYGAAKAAAESFLWAACAGDGSAGMSGVVLRAGPIVGAPALPGGAFRSDRRIAALVDAARRGEALRVMRGEGRQFVAAEDVARAVVLAIEEPRTSGTYLCVDREITSWESIARRAAELMQSKSGVVTEDGPADTVIPRFDDTRVAALLGGPLDSRAAMESHLKHMASAPTED